MNSHFVVTFKSLRRTEHVTAPQSQNGGTGGVELTP